MAEKTHKSMRLGQVARQLNVGTQTIVDFLVRKGFTIEHKVNAKITKTQYEQLSKEFAQSIQEKKKASTITIEKKIVTKKIEEKNTQILVEKNTVKKKDKIELPKLQSTFKCFGKIDIEKKKTTSTSINKNKIDLQGQVSTTGLKIVGKMDIPLPKSAKKFKQVTASDHLKNTSKVTAKKKVKNKVKVIKKHRSLVKKQPVDISQKEIQAKIRKTLAKITKEKQAEKNVVKYRKEKREIFAQNLQKKKIQAEKEKKVLKISEFISVNDLAILMNIPTNQLLSACISLGVVTSINQRLDQETIGILAEEFGYSVVFTTLEEQEEQEIQENEALQTERAPIVTIMGHVDHGKTSLLDYIRSTQVTQQEAGSITQHIGAYDVETKNNKRVVFLDTPGHEAFTAMRARGAKITDIVVVIVAADDGVMPQTQEAINHAKAAGVPIIIAINKIDKPQANIEKIKEELSKVDVLVESWGGKIQSQNISAKSGEGVDELLEKILLEAEMLELKANANRKAQGTVLEASLDKGRGYVATLINQKGTLRVGDIILTGMKYGKVKAMFNHRGKKLKSIPPATPVQILGLNGAPQAGDTFLVMESEKEAREIASHKAIVHREQYIQTKKRITLNEINQKLSMDHSQEINIIIKGDVDGSIQALADALQKLSTVTIKINIIHQAIGQISESDVLLAASSNAMIIGFQVRPTPQTRKLAAKEGIEINLYTVIYDAIEEIKKALKGMLAPKEKEKILGHATIKTLFKISKIGTIAGSVIDDGVIQKNNAIRLIRNGVVVHTGSIYQLKHFQEDAKEVKKGQECGISIKNFNDIKIGDSIECFVIVNKTSK